MRDKSGDAGIQNLATVALLEARKLQDEADGLPGELTEDGVRAIAEQFGESVAEQFVAFLRLTEGVSGEQLEQHMRDELHADRADALKIDAIIARSGKTPRGRGRTSHFVGKESWQGMETALLDGLDLPAFTRALAKQRKIDGRSRPRKRAKTKCCHLPQLGAPVRSPSKRSLDLGSRHAAQTNSAPFSMLSEQTDHVRSSSTR